MWASMSVSVRERQREYTFQRRLHTNGCVRVSEVHVWVMRENATRYYYFFLGNWDTKPDEYSVPVRKTLTPLTLALARSEEVNIKDRLD